VYRRFGLVLMVNHACNLRCAYCYTGRKFAKPMPPEIGRRAIERAMASIVTGGTLELGFFGGEPLIEAELIEHLIDHARRTTRRLDIQLELSLTTNGTLADGGAWRVMTRGDLDLMISHDGLPVAHDRHRLTVNGQPTSASVERTMRDLYAAGKAFCTNTVVRPESLEKLPDGVRHLRQLGVTHTNLSLDLWTRWSPAEAARLFETVERLADVWVEGLPRCGINWFDEKALKLAAVPVSESARCGFGDGEIAVAPSGRLYPCERLIGEDEESNAARLPGEVMNGPDFLFGNDEGERHREREACGGCGMYDACNTACRCSNVVRTGDPATPDGLLCAWNEACLRAVASRTIRPVPLRIAS
jgi:uncharacterized protein